MTEGFARKPSLSGEVERHKPLERFLNYFLDHFLEN